MQDYHRIKAWEKAHQFVLVVYSATKKFPKEELFGVTSQLRRASVSIPANIVEGSGRKTNADFGRFVTISIGSTNEVEYYLLLARDLGYLIGSEHDLLRDRVIEIRKMLISFLARLS